MPKIFLSHSSAQKRLVEKIANKIGSDKCIYDKYTFELGMDTLGEILTALESTDIFVVFLSEEALNSKWVMTELNQAKSLYLLNNIKQFLPIIIDPTITHTDARIPIWLKARVLKVLTEPYLIIKKIEQRNREIILDNNPFIRAKYELFVGRNHLMEEFETQLLTLDGKKPVSFIASGVEGIGRRTFMQKALIKTKYIDELYEPISIFLDAKDSIEDFIIRIHETSGVLDDDILESLHSKNLHEKEQEAKAILLQIVNTNEKLFILDSGCIIKPSKQISPWFLNITNSVELDNTLSVVIISRFRPNPNFILKNKRVKALHVDALSSIDIKKLFVAYKDLLELNISVENSQKILDSLNGIPSQVHFALDLVKASNVDHVIRNLDDVIEYGEAKVFYIIEEFQKDKKKLDILVLIAKIDFISYDLLYKIVGRTKENERILEEFFEKGIYDTFGGFSEHIRMHYAIGDYIKRSKFSIAPHYKQKIKSIYKEFLSNKNINIDVSAFLLTVKNALTDGVKVPDRYLLPSFVLKSIVEIYYSGKYRKVIKLIDKVLENVSKMDGDMERELKYWLCLALAREKDPRFEHEISGIDGADYEFLYGFYYRRKRDFDRAITYFKNAISKSSSYHRAKRELVNVLLAKGQYDIALETAKENYENQRTNAFHIQAYFICLVRKKGLKVDETKTINLLLVSMKKTNEKKSEEMHLTMTGEYQYYIKKNPASAIKSLKESLQKSQFKYYPYKALYELYMKQGYYSDAENLKANYDKEHYAIDELETL